MRVLEFVFGSVWHFLGVLILLILFCDLLKDVVASLIYRWTSAGPRASIGSGPSNPAPHNSDLEI